MQYIRIWFLMNEEQINRVKFTIIIRLDWEHVKEDRIIREIEM